MGRLILSFLVLLLLNSYLPAQVLLQEDFAGLSGAVSTDPSASIYQILADGTCDAEMSWRFESTNASSTLCNACSGIRAIISFSETCPQDATLVLGNFIAPESTVPISFDYGYNDFSPSVNSDFFQLILYNETLSTGEILLDVGVDMQNANYAEEVAVLPGNEYSLRLRYVGDYDWGMTFDNLLVGEVILPITLSSFEVETADKLNQVKWSWENAANFAEFILECSENGAEYYEIYRADYVDMDGASHQYSHAPTHPVTYYRLKMLDLDGTFAYSPIRVVSNNYRVSDGPIFYPNPVSGNVLNVDNPFVKKTISIYNSVGQLVHTAQLAPSTTSRLTLDVPNGLYTVLLVGEGKDTLQVKQLVVLRK